MKTFTGDKLVFGNQVYCQFFYRKKGSWNSWKTKFI